MATASLDASEVLRDIRVAFANVTRPSDEDLLWTPGADPLWIESFLGGDEPWSQLPADLIRFEVSALTAVSPAGFLFFLPAYMCWTLEHEGDDSCSGDNTIYALDLPPDGGTTHAIMLQRFAALSEPQNRAVAKFLKYASANDARMDATAATRALTAYWSRFL